MTGNGLLILLALWVEGAVSLGLLWLMGSRRIPLVMNGKIAIGAIALSREPWPDKAKQASNAFDNQFQLPVLLFVASFAVLYLGPNVFEVLLAWLFVLSRIVHAAIHVTSNHVIRRFSAYVFGYGVLIALWLDLLGRLLIAFFWSR
jgi:hypothetical protein